MSGHDAAGWHHLSDVITGLVPVIPLRRLMRFL
jgi:hypothetical protein